MMNKIISLLTLIIILIFTINYLYDRHHSSKQFNTEVWGHRGGSKYLKLPDNSPAALKKITNVGWKGIEIDCYYDFKSKKIVISHDKKFQKFKGKYFFLNEIDIPSKVSIWLDFKNLNMLDKTEIIQVNKTLLELSKKNKIYVESQNIVNLFRIKKSGVKTVFNLSINSNNIVNIFFLKLTHIILNFDFISITSNQFDLVRKYFPLNIIFTFTLNDEKKICDIINKKQAFVILTKIPEKIIDCY